MQVFDWLRAACPLVWCGFYIRP
uniref:Uncharacterized protein n=1 Tax=Anguilla anguilla TaxID=7936 RepID=A0A0E9UJA4_ANGAN